VSKQTVGMDTIQSFLAQKRIAMIGISRDPKSFSAQLFQEFMRRRYEMIPVNPQGGVVAGKQCVVRVQDIKPPVEAAIVMTTPEVTEHVVRDCAEAGVWRIWMFRGAGKGSVSRKAVEFCREHGMQVIPGECPFMFFPHTEFFHRAHGFFRKMAGHYPQPSTA
jgi:predicted CoA-binding protein